jgi:OOP family OmpA-OmpF porin
MRLPIHVLAVLATLCFVGGAHAQKTLSAEDIVNSLQNKASRSQSSLSAEEILNRIRNLAVTPEGVASTSDQDAVERAEIATVVAKLPSLNMEVFFDYNSASIKPDTLPMIAALGTALGDPRLSGSKFVIAGHTDAVGSNAYNLKLSQARAAAVKKFLIQSFPLDATRLTPLGLGEEQPRDPANPDAAINRRVQVINVGN